MGRVKIEIKQLINSNGRQAMYSKRKQGILKKAHELSVLCDIDLVLLMFSPTGKAAICCGRQSVEEVITKYARVPAQERMKRKLEGLQALKKTFLKSNHDVNIPDFDGSSTPTTKRNLKIMINASISVNQEKDNKFQQIKTEVVELIKEHGSYSKPIKQQPCSADDFQESHLEDKGVVKVRFAMDPVLEDKICDLYDIFVDGLDDDVARQARKLYAELAELWPKGTMDNHGVKRAICHSKERRKIFLDRNKEQETIQAKKLVAQKEEESSQADSTANIQPQHTESNFFGNTTANSTTMTVSFTNPPVDSDDFILSKHEKTNDDFTHSHIEFRKPDGTLVKKKVKRKHEVNSSEVQPRPEKVSRHSEERPKSLNQQTEAAFVVAAAPQNQSFGQLT